MSKRARADATKRDPTLELMEELTSLPGVPGAEEAVVAALKRRLGGVALAEEDRIGNVFFTHEGSGPRPRILLPAHMDEIGMMVKLIDPKGFIKFQNLGGFASQTFLSQRVTVINGKGEKVPGLIGSKPPHLQTAEERNKVVSMDECFIDVGAASKEDVEKRLGIIPGDMIVPDAPFTVMAGGKRVMAKAWDDRIGVALMVRIMEELKRRGHPNTVIGCGTVQEEIGARGARTIASTWDLDVAIVLEGGLPGDTPGIKPEETQGDLGKGPMICLRDGGQLPHKGLRDFILETARREKIPVQPSILTAGSTDGSVLQYAGRGVPSLYLGVPTRYIHTHQGIIDLDDFENSLRLVVAVIRRLDRKAFQEMLGKGRR